MVKPTLVMKQPMSTIDTHRKNLLAKFDAKNVALIMRMAIKLKYI